MCKIFLEYLTGSANKWFNKLPRGNILSFRNLVFKFFNKFFQQARAPESYENILYVKQRRDESLNDYMTRFTSESIKLCCSSDELIILAFQNRLRLGPLYQKLRRFVST